MSICSVISESWRYLGNVSIGFDSDIETFLPFEFTQPLVGIKASSTQSNFKESWIKAGYLTQYFNSDLGVVTTTSSQLVRFEAQIIEFWNVPSYKIKFRPVPWIGLVDLSIYVPS